MSENKADQLRAEMRGRHAAELAAPGWKGLHNEPNRHRARGDMDAWCDWCGDCAEDQPCRCCLAVEVEALRDQNAELLATLTELAPLSHKVRAEKAEAAIARVRELHHPIPGFNGSQWCDAHCEATTDGDPTYWPCETVRALDGGAK